MKAKFDDDAGIRHGEKWDHGPEKNAKFTPGPWNVVEKRPGVVESNPVDLFIADTFDVFDDEQRAANATLIAAAPEMYEALDKCAEWIDIHFQSKGSSGHECPAFQQAIAVISKARGEKETSK